MPLPPSAVDRQLLHTRHIVCEGYERSDGLFDIEGWLTDTKTEPNSTLERANIPPGEPIHSMGLRVTIDAAFTIREAVAAMDYTPMAICPNAAPNFTRLVGITLTAGFRQKVTAAVGGTVGCTHLIELLGNMATAAYQTIRGRNPRRRPGTVFDKPPATMNSCLGWAEDGPLIKRDYPEFYTGPRETN